MLAKFDRGVSLKFGKSLCGARARPVGGDSDRANYTKCKFCIIKGRSFDKGNEFGTALTRSTTHMMYLLHRTDAVLSIVLMQRRWLIKLILYDQRMAIRFFALAVLNFTSGFAILICSQLRP